MGARRDDGKRAVLLGLSVLVPATLVALAALLPAPVSARPAPRASLDATRALTQRSKAAHERPTRSTSRTATRSSGRPGVLLPERQRGRDGARSRRADLDLAAPPDLSPQLATADLSGRARSTAGARVRWSLAPALAARAPPSS